MVGRRRMEMKATCFKGYYSNHRNFHVKENKIIIVVFFIFWNNYSTPKD